MYLKQKIFQSVNAPPPTHTHVNMHCVPLSSLKQLTWYTNYGGGDKGGGSPNHQHPKSQQHQQHQTTS